jgi:peptide chain release factor 1
MINATILFNRCLGRSLIIRHPQRTTLFHPKHGRRYFLSDAVTRRLDTMVARHAELLASIENSPGDSFTYGKELASLAHVASLHEKRVSLEAEEVSIQELLKDASKESDEDMEQECQEELELLQTDKVKLEKKICNAIIPKDENDFRSNAIVEIRAGTGGDEACIFASELRETYEKTAKAMRWDYDIMSENRTDLGGIKETVLSISGRGGRMMFAAEEDDDDDDDFKSNIGPYGLFKYESGVHRVQRVPVNDTLSWVEEIGAKEYKRITIHRTESLITVVSIQLMEYQSY